MHINVYVRTTIKGPRRSDGVAAYVIEEDGTGRIVTDFRYVKDVTSNQAELRILGLALSKIKKKCDLTIYTDLPYVAEGLEKWAFQWKDNNWVTTRGKEISNKVEWQYLLKILNGTSFEVECKEQHIFSSWLDMELKNRRKQ